MDLKKRVEQINFKTQWQAEFLNGRNGQPQWLLGITEERRGRRGLPRGASGWCEVERPRWQAFPLVPHSQGQSHYLRRGVPRHRSLESTRSAPPTPQQECKPRHPASGSSNVSTRKRNVSRMAMKGRSWQSWASSPERNQSTLNWKNDPARTVLSKTEILRLFSSVWPSWEVLFFFHFFLLSLLSLAVLILSIVSVTKQI